MKTNGFKTSLVIGTESGIPYGFAASNYVRLLAKGLVDAGAKVHILIPWHTENRIQPRNTAPVGSWGGFSYEYTTGTPLKPRSTHTRIQQIVHAHTCSYQKLRELKANGRLDALIYYGNHLENHLIYQGISRALKIPFISFLVEWYPSIPGRNPLRKLYDRLFTFLTIHTSDVVVVISRFLEQKVLTAKSNLLSPPKCFRIPILVDPQVWGEIHPHATERPYVLFCADLDGYFTDACFLIKAMEQLHEPDIDLMFIGHAGSDTRDRLLRYATQTGLQSEILINNQYHTDSSLRGLYAGASALLAPLHNDTRSMARFPSKIADYLMSARPVVSCDVGEVAEFLKDRQTAFLCRPDDLTAFSESLKLALQDENREKVAQNGSLIAQQYFDYRIHGRRLLDFINTL